MSLPKKSLSEAFLDTHLKVIRYNDPKDYRATDKED